MRSSWCVQDTRWRGTWTVWAASCLLAASTLPARSVHSQQPGDNLSSCAQGAQRLRVEASSRLQLLSLDVSQVVMFILI